VDIDVVRGRVIDDRLEGCCVRTGRASGAAAREAIDVEGDRDAAIRAGRSGVNVRCSRISDVRGAQLPADLKGVGIDGDRRCSGAVGIARRILGRTASEGSRQRGLGPEHRPGGDQRQRHAQHDGDRQKTSVVSQGNSSLKCVAAEPGGPRSHRFVRWQLRKPMRLTLPEAGAIVRRLMNAALSDRSRRRRRTGIGQAAA